MNKKKSGKSKKQSKKQFKKILLLFFTIVLIFIFLEFIYRLKYLSEPEFDYNNLLEQNKRYGEASDNLVLSYVPHINYSNGIYTINSQGLRDKEYDITKPDNTFRILTFGDSVTFGYDVELKNLYSEVLEGLLNNYSQDLSYEVINFGVDGYNTLQESELFRDKGINYNPNLVIVGFVLNDVGLPWMTPFNKTTIMQREDIINDFLPKKCSIKTNIKRFFDKSVFLRKNSIFNIKAKIYTYFDPGHDNFIIITDWESGLVRWNKIQYADECIFGKIEHGFETFYSLAEEINAPVVLVIFPNKFFGESYPQLEIHEKVRDAAEERNLIVFDLQKDFELNGNNILFLPHDTGHPNVQGHYVAASEIFDFLRQKNLIPE